MPNSQVIITGAGFSRQGDLPVQNAILKELISPSKTGFMASSVSESIKYLQAFIEVGIYLLTEFTTTDTGGFSHIYTYLQRQHSSQDLIEEINSRIHKDILEKMIAKFISNGLSLKNKSEVDEVITELSFDVNALFSTYSLSIDDYYLDLIKLKESVRNALETSKIDVNLEDVFTSFDKTSISKEHGHKYSYSQMDNLRYAIMRLFVYHFGSKTAIHSFTDPNYQFTVDYIKNNISEISVISTNWDTLFEHYLDIAGIKCDLGLSDRYYKYDTSAKNKCTKKRGIKYLKVHGSVNWSRCLSCGGITISDKAEFADYLFNDRVKEACSLCGSVSENNTVLLQPEIITPTMIKSINNQLFLNIWKSASTVLNKSERIIFVGYSLPVADYDFRYLIKKNINPNTVIDVVLASNDNPKLITKRKDFLRQSLPEYRFRSLFSQNKLNFYYDGFGEYFRAR